MKRILLAFLVLLVLSVSVPANSAQDMTMWSCAPVGERRTVLYVVDRGSRSYVKIGGQRATARISTRDDTKRWAWGNNSISLSSADYKADYFEGDTLKARFQCKLVSR